MEGKMKEDKKYTVNNPTQINNYGSQENSAQTIWKNIKETIKDPSNFTDHVFIIINELFKLVIRTIWLTIKLSIMPVAFVTSLGIILFTFQQAISLDILLGHIFGGIGAVFSGAGETIPHIIKSPIIIIYGCFILLSYIMAVVFSKHMYKEDKEKQKIAKKAMFITFILAIISGIAEAWGKADKKE